MKKTLTQKTKAKTEIASAKYADVSKEHKIAFVSLSPEIVAAKTTIGFSNGLFGEPDYAETISVLQENVRQIKNGDLSELEGTLATQAITLNSIFNEMARRSAANLGNNLHLSETYLRMALKAQAQSRATIETLAEVKNPRAPTFVKQQNNAYQQQVNNQAENIGNTHDQNMVEDHPHTHGSK